MRSTNRRSRSVCGAGVHLVLAACCAFDGPKSVQVGPAGRGGCRAAAAGSGVAGGGNRIGAVAPVGQARVEQAEVHVAERGDVLAHHALRVRRAHAAHADRGDVDQVARRRHALAEHVARHDHHARAGDGGVLDEAAARDAASSPRQCEESWVAMANPS